jgi:hypothetical protein
LLQPYYPQIADLAVHWREDDREVRYLAPPQAVIAEDIPEGYEVRWIVFPAYSPDARNELQPLPKIETIGRLLAECLSLPRKLSKDDVVRLVAWMERVEGYRLTNSSLTEAVRLTTGLSR